MSMSNVFRIVGGILLLIPVAKGAIGFTSSDMGWMITLLALGVVVIVVGDRAFRGREKFTKSEPR